MGNAVLHYPLSKSFELSEHILLIWGDIPLIHPETVRATVERHLENKNNFTFPTKFVQSAYTVVNRNANNEVVEVLETREESIRKAQPGERDIGLFVFRKKKVLDLLAMQLPGKYGKTTQEHGFLYIVKHLVERGSRVEGLPIAKDNDLISLNKIQDLDGITNPIN